MRIDFQDLPPQPLNNILTGQWKVANLPPRTSVQQERSMTFTVSYPYAVSRSISSNAVDQQIGYLHAKKALPNSTLRFIQQSLNKQLQQVDDAAYDASQLDIKNSHSIAASQIIISPQKSAAKFQKLKLNNLSRDNLAKNKKQHDIKSRVYDPKPVRKQPQIIHEKIIKKTNMPLLQQTRTSKIAKKVTKKREKHFQQSDINVFQSLYNDANLYASKRQVEKVMNQLQQSKNLISRKIIQNRSRINVSSTFEQRYSRSLERQADRQRKASTIIQFDIHTGRQFYKPDISKSRMSFTKTFKQKSIFFQEINVDTGMPMRNSFYSKESSKLNRSLQLSSTHIGTILEKTDSYEPVELRTVLKQVWIAQIYADLLCDGQSLKINRLNQKQIKVFGNFFQKFQQFKYGVKISKQIFMALFKDFYDNLNLYDRQIFNVRLRESQKNRRQLIKAKKQTQKVIGKPKPKPKKYNTSQLDHTYKSFYI